MPPPLYVTSPSYYIGTTSGTFWDFNTTATSGTLNNSVWSNWATNTGILTTNEFRVANGLSPCDYYPLRSIVVDPREELIRANRVRAQRLRARVQRRAAAHAADELLTSLMTDEQRDEYQRMARIHVVAPDGKRYRIRRGWAGNLEVIDNEDRPVERWCVHPRVSVPEADNMIAQKLMIESGRADELRRIANVTRLHVA